MRLVTILFIFFLSMSQMSGQFEQKLSLNLSAGAFQTIGHSTYLPEDAVNSEAYEPALMTNFRPGFSFSAGMQYNLSRNLSIEASFDLSKSNYWYYDFSDGSSEPSNYLYFEILSDPVNYIVQKSGENELFLTSLHVGIAPRYYFRPGKKFNPYLFAGLNISYIDVHFQNLEYEAYVDLGKEAEYEPNPDEQWHDYNTNMGFNTGIGAEYTLGDNLGLFFQARYHFVLLGEYDFSLEPIYLDYHSMELHLGVRISFLKSKDL